MSSPPHRQMNDKKPAILEQEPPVMEIGPVPEIYVDGYSGSITTGATAKLPFYTLKFDFKGQRMVRMPVLVLTMPLYVLDGVHRALGEFIEQVRNAQAGLK